MALDGLNHLLRHSRWQKLLVNDRRKIGLNQHAAVERRQRLGEFQRIDQHGHAAGRSSARDTELNSRLAQTQDRVGRTLRQRLLLRDQRSIDIRYHHPDRLSRAFIFRCHL